MEKAYNMVWIEGLLFKLDNMGIGGRMFNWFHSFLFDRSIQVRVGSLFSKTYIIENGTPQGSVCSPILFNIMINDIFPQVSLGVEKSLFAEDGALWKRGRDVQDVVKGMQNAINEVEKWTDKWGFHLSVSKTQEICFSERKS